MPVDREETGTGCGEALRGGRTAPLKPTPGLSGPPAFKQIKGISSVTGADLVPGFNKYQGLLDSPIYRVAETFGHEGAHGLFSIQNPAEAVGLQQILNDRDASMRGYKYPYPPDVMQKIEAADKALIPTEKFAQQEEKIINGELQADKKKQ